MSEVNFIPSTTESGVFEARTACFLLRVRPSPKDKGHYDAEVEYIRREGVPLPCGTRPNRQLAEGLALLRALEIAEKEVARFTFPRLPCEKCGHPVANDADFDVLLSKPTTEKTTDVLCYSAVTLRRNTDLGSDSRAILTAQADCEERARRAREAARGA